MDDGSRAEARRTSTRSHERVLGSSPRLSDRLPIIARFHAWAGAVVFPADRRAFVAEKRWTFARTMPGWPRECFVREQVDDELFERLVVHIRTHGVEGRFYERPITNYQEAALV